jgi:serine/threonine protein kinase
LENILLDDNYDLKLIDFGVVAGVSHRQYSLVGTDGYMAPEIYFG